MKVLIIGDASSIFVKQYIEYVLLDGTNQVVLLQENPLFEGYREFYESNNVQIEPLWNKKNSFIKKIPVIRSILGAKLWCSYIKKKYKHFDLIHVHGVNRSRGNIGKYLRNICDKLLVSVWGDEIFRNSPETMKKHKVYYSCADRITMATKVMVDRFNSVYNNEFAAKVSMNKFAIGLFDKIDVVKKEFTREQICEEFGIKHPEKTLVFVGHNGREAQRHTELTKELLNLPQELKDNIILIYTMTYGVRDNAYIEEMEAAAKQTGCEYVILRDFMNEETSAKLRSICDIMLHAQLTDGFSASIQESLYSGSIIINGSWLPYNELPDYKECVVEYDDITQIGQVLQTVLENQELYKSKFKANRDILRQISSLEITTEKWKSTIELCMNA
ncbi:MAG: glycosyltransferase [Clostridia bacterium]|nr:glycosyltransferase [Clostridia bacterium]